MLFKLKPRFQLIWLFVVTTVVALIIGFLTRRQDSLEAELELLVGTWNS